MQAPLFIKICDVDVSLAIDTVSSFGEKEWETGMIRQLTFINHKDAQSVLLKWGFRVQPEFKDVKQGKEYFKYVVNTDTENEYSKIWDDYKHVFKPVIDEVLKNITPEKSKNPKIARILIANLQAGGSIGSHTDGCGSISECMRIHIPLVTNEKATLTIKSPSTGKTVTKHLTVGHAFEINNKCEHSAENLGLEDGLHIILDVYDGDKKWL